MISKIKIYVRMNVNVNTLNKLDNLCNATTKVKANEKGGGEHVVGTRDRVSERENKIEFIESIRNVRIKHKYKNRAEGSLNAMDGEIVTVIGGDTVRVEGDVERGDSVLTKVAVVQSKTLGKVSLAVATASELALVEHSEGLDREEVPQGVDVVLQGSRCLTHSQNSVADLAQTNEIPSLNA